MPKRAGFSISVAQGYGKGPGPHASGRRSRAQAPAKITPFAACLMTLVDTSVWIAVFRAHRPLDLERVVPFDEVVTCLPVIQEVLQGFRDNRAFHHAREAMLSLPGRIAPARGGIHPGRDLYRLARRAGLNIRSSVDCLIAACAIRKDLEILHSDRDYASLARVSSLRERSVNAK